MLGNCGLRAVGRGGFVFACRRPGRRCLQESVCEIRQDLANRRGTDVRASRFSLWTQSRYVSRHLTEHQPKFRELLL
jgi:hypothetical protein